jgi:hypothetical protein
MEKRDGLFKLTQTSRIIWSLGVIAALCIAAETFLVWADRSTSESLLTLAATAVGGIAGLAVPTADKRKDDEES